MDSDTPLWVPPLSPKTQKQLKRRRKQPLKKLIKWATISDKGLWDWLQLLAVLAVPIAITLGTMWFSTQQSQVSIQVGERQHQTDLQTSEKQHQTDIQIANDQQQETALQTYLDRMSDLLLNNNLRESQSGEEVREVARSRTLTVLPQLNGTRKGELVHFLKEANLIEKQNAIVSLRGADLSNVDLYGADLSNVDLINANLA